MCLFKREFSEDTSKLQIGQVISASSEGCEAVLDSVVDKLSRLSSGLGPIGLKYDINVPWLLFGVWRFDTLIPANAHQNVVD